MYPHLFSSLTLRGLTLRNRIVFAPTTMGLPENEYLAKLRAISEGGAAVLVIGDVPVLDEPRGSLFDADGFARYCRVTEAVHAGGALACAQLHMSDTDMAGLRRFLPDVQSGKITPDELRRILNGLVSDYVTGLPADRVRGITAAFGPAARRAAEAGFDLVQVHGDRMCGSFSSSIYNRRTDAYGGTPENRARFAVEAVRAVREAMPELPIDFKLAVRQEEPHYGNAGVLLSELSVFVPALEAAGADSFHVTLADHGELSDTIPARSHPYFGEEGCFLKYSDAVRKLTDKPVCGVGALSSPAFIEAQLASGRIALAAMSRQLIADPDWPRKVREGREAALRRCVRCNKKCLGGMQSRQGVHCIYDA